MIKKQVGISVYPGIIDTATCKKQIDTACELGYTKLFTGFTCAANEVVLTEDYVEIFHYAKQKGLELHVDINNFVMEALGITSSNLLPIVELGIPVIRIDCGVSLEEIVEMTNNPYGILIEENLSNHRTLQEKMEAIQQRGTMKNYCACHNFYPRINSGLEIAYAMNCARIAKSYHCQTGAFIGSIYSDHPLNPNGKATMTIEKHRYIPAHLQAMELFSSELFDFLIFGDSEPRADELKAVARTTRNAYECLSLKQQQQLSEAERKEYEELYCIQLPIYFESYVKEKEEIKSLVMRNRIDLCEEAIRVMNWRGKRSIEVNNVIPRPRYSVTMDNLTTELYKGEIEILLKDMPAVPYANVIGMVKPCGISLVDIARSGKVMFQLSEE